VTGETNPGSLDDEETWEEDEYRSGLKPLGIRFSVRPRDSPDGPELWECAH
jgi:hypothetical protein